MLMGIAGYGWVSGLDKADYETDKDSHIKGSDYNPSFFAKSLLISFSAEIVRSLCLLSVAVTVTVPLSFFLYDHK